MEAIDVVIEISAGSRVKKSLHGGVWVEEFRSPWPSLFNYGAILGTQGADGAPQDVVVLGPRLAAGSRLRVFPVACVRFWDDGLRDDKTVALRRPGRLTGWQRLLLVLFFTVYAAFKRRRGRPCRFDGVTT